MTGWSWECFLTGLALGGFLMAMILTRQTIIGR